MQKLLLICFFHFTALAIILSCSSGIANEKHWASWMTCPSDQIISGGNLVWGNFAATPTTSQAMPGDTVHVSMTIFNDCPGNNGNISNASNIRLFLSYDTILGPEDYFIAEYVMPGIYANSSIFIVDDFVLPNITSPPNFFGSDADSDKEIIDINGNPTGQYYKYNELYFPATIPSSDINDPNYNPSDPSRPEYIGPNFISFYIIAVLDAQNCVIEEGGTEPETPVHEHQSFYTDNIFIDSNPANRLQLWNPNLPNLEIKFIGLQPSAAMPQRGTSFFTQWEVLNSGVGPVLGTKEYGIRVYLSENNSIDSWDRNIVVRNPDTHPIAIGPDGLNREDGSNDDSFVLSGPLPGNSNAVITVTCRMPYEVFKQNVYPGWSSSVDLWNGVDDYSSREPPPTGIPGYVFIVGAPIPSNGSQNNILIARIDSTNTIREASELDNESTTNGSLTVGYVNGGSFDLEINEVIAQFQNNSLDTTIKYSSSLPAATTESIAFYLSENDTAQSADFFMERFWYTINSGNQLILNTSFSPPAYTPGPPSGSYYVVTVLDDIFKETELYEDNNYGLSLNSINYTR